MAHLSFQHREMAGGAMGIAERPEPSQRPCMVDCRKHAELCRPADCPAHQCSAWQRWDADQRRIGLRRWATEAVEAELAAPAEWDGEERPPVAPKTGPGSSRYRGVNWHEPTRKWRAHIWVNHERIDLGYHADEREAAMRYNDEAMARGLPAWRQNVIEEEEHDG